MKERKEEKKEGKERERESLTLVVELLLYREHCARQWGYKISTVKMAEEINKQNISETPCLWKRPISPKGTLSLFLPKLKSSNM